MLYDLLVRWWSLAELALLSGDEPLELGTTLEDGFLTGKRWRAEGG